MEEFENIDWLPNVEDIIDDKFLDEERLKKEGVMYNLLNGTFQDPFADIRESNYSYKKQTPRKTNQNTGNNETHKKKNENAENSEGTPKRQRGRPKKKKD